MFLGQMFVLAAGVILLPVYWSYCMVVANPWYIVDGGIAVMAGGIGATICLAGAMTFLDKRLNDAPPLSGAARLGLETEKRLLALLELGTTALALSPLAVLIFHVPLIGR